MFVPTRLPPAHMSILNPNLDHVQVCLGQSEPWIDLWSFEQIHYRQPTEPALAEIQKSDESIQRMITQA